VYLVLHASYLATLFGMWVPVDEDHLEMLRNIEIFGIKFAIVSSAKISGENC